MFVKSISMEDIFFVFFQNVPLALCLDTFVTQSQVTASAPQTLRVITANDARKIHGGITSTLVARCGNFRSKIYY